MPPAALVSILQKGLQYVEAEISINEVRVPWDARRLPGPKASRPRGSVRSSVSEPQPNRQVP